MSAAAAPGGIGGVSPQGKDHVVSLDLFGRVPLSEVESRLSDSLPTHPGVKVIVTPVAAAADGEAAEQVITVAGVMGKKMTLRVGAEEILVNNGETLGDTVGNSAASSLRLGYTYLAAGVAVVALGAYYIGKWLLRGRSPVEERGNDTRSS